VGFGLPCLRDYLVDLSVFEEKSIIGECDEVLLFVKSIPLLTCVPESQMDNEIGKMINFRHLCISAPIGFVLPIESENPHGLKMIRLYLQGFSLANFLQLIQFGVDRQLKRKSLQGLCLVFGLPTVLNCCMAI
jgi:hypothetical protein